MHITNGIELVFRFVAGSTRCFDQNCIVHSIWKKLVLLGANAWIDRVPTKDNISDDPSREGYELHELLGAKKVEAAWDDIFTDGQTRGVLTMLECVSPK